MCQQNVSTCMCAQMVSELKDQNGLLKTEKDDLNRLIQEQSQQMTGVQTESSNHICVVIFSKKTNFISFGGFF